MMKKLLAVLLVTVMLLGMLPMTAVAETTTPQFKGYKLFLKESIAISFYAEPAKLEGFTKVVFSKNGQEVETVETLPEASSDGLVYFTFSKLGPHEMGAEITAELYINGVVADTRTKSVLDYCTAKLGDNTSSAQLKTLIVDMLNYGAAAQTYVAEDTATEVGTLVNAGLTTEQMNLGAISDPQLELLEGLDTTLDGAEVTWKQAALTLNSGIVMNFAFSVDSTDGLSMELTCGEKTWTVSEFGETVIDNVTYTTCEFDGLNPAQMRDVVYVVAKRDGVEISDKKAYSVEHYAAAKVSELVSAAISSKTATAETSLVNLVNAMMQYGDAVAMYATEHTYDANGKCTACNVAHYSVGDKATWLEAEEMDLLSKREYDLRWAENPSATQDTHKKPITVENTGVVRFNRDQVPSSDTNVAHLSFETTATADGTYSIWIKAYAKNTTTNHVYVSVDADGVAPAYKAFKPTSASTSATDLIWFKLGEYSWTEGQDYTVRIRGYYSQFPRIDQIVITSDSAFKPTDHNHTVNTTEYAHDEEYHWNEASCCQGVTANKAEHTFVNMICSVCNANYLDQKVIEAEDANLFSGADQTNQSYKTDQVTSSAVNPIQYFTNEYASGSNQIVRLNGYYTHSNTPADVKPSLLLATNPAHLSFTHTAEQTGTYYIWAKVVVNGTTANYLKYIDGDGTSGDSQYMYTAHSGMTSCSGTWGSNVFNWVKVGTYEWTEGNTYTIRLRGANIYTAFDQFVLTNDADFNPAN